jgi:hypothetical protein
VVAYAKDVSGQITIPRFLFGVGTRHGVGTKHDPYSGMASFEIGAAEHNLVLEYFVACAIEVFPAVTSFYDGL